jgi:hypothetical protein
MSQRAVAKATRIKYGLQTFSHSTICRSFKTLEYAAAYCRQEYAQLKHFKKDDVTNHTKDLLIIRRASGYTHDSNDNAIQANTNPNKSRTFPAVADTAERRKVIFKFVPKLSHNLNLIDIEAACCWFVEKRHEKLGRLLL